ncbi:transcriptional regulator domain protein [Bacteroides fragilis str. 3986 N(B)19]|nr:transcriptional regulator domain protein [Bacteroides fragilis str. 3986 N(B)19]
MQLYERTLGQWLEHWAETTPDKEYIVYSDRNLRFTWKQFNKRVDDMAKGLIAIGVENGSYRHDQLLKQRHPFAQTHAVSFTVQVKSRPPYGAVHHRCSPYTRQ